MSKLVGLLFISPLLASCANWEEESITFGCVAVLILAVTVVLLALPSGGLPTGGRCSVSPAPA